MTRPRPRIGSELFPLALILACVAGTLHLVLTMHRNALPPRTPDPASPKAVVQAPPAPAKPPSPSPRARRPTPPPPLPSPPPDDPTKKVLADLSKAQAEQVARTAEADRRAESLERAARTALAASQSWRRRERLVRDQIDDLSRKADELEQEVDTLALQRDALARERDHEKAALAKARVRSSYAVLPHKAANGTWRRPIIIECHNGSATLQPNGPTFSLLDLAAGSFAAPSSPIVLAVARELIRSRALATPDGAPAVPYIFFVVRPDGIRPYYEARGRLEPLGIAFGYELVDQNMEIDYPDLDSVDEWDGAPGAHASPELASRSPSRTASRPGTARSGADPADSFIWPAHPSGGGSSASGDVGLPGGARGSARRGGGTGSGTSPHGPPGWSTPVREDLPTGDGLGDGLYPVPGTPGSLPPGLIGAGGSPTRRPVPFGDPNDDDEFDGVAGGGSEPPGGTNGGGTGPNGPRGSLLPPFASASDAPGSPPTGPFTPSFGEAAGQGGGRPMFGGQGSPGGRGRTSGDGPPGLVPVDPNGLPGLLPPSPSGGADGSPPASEAGGAESGGLDWPSATPANRGGPPAGGSLGAGVGTGAANPAPPGSNGSASSPARATGPRRSAVALAAAPGSNGSGGTGQFLSDAPEASGSPSSGGSNAASQPPLGLALGASPGSSGGSSNPLGLGTPSPGQSSGPPPDGSAGQAGGTGSSSSTEGKPDPNPSKASRRESIDEPKRIEVPFEIVVACERTGIIIHPGGYRLSPKSLDSKDSMLLKELQSVLRRRQLVDPTIRPVPGVRFLVEHGGSEMYWKAHRQYVLSGLDWPTTLQVGDTSVLSLLPKERW